MQNTSSVPPLVSAKWLAQRLDDPQIRIVDTRPTMLYRQGHIKNAVSASYGKSEYQSCGVDVSRGGGVELYADPSAPTPSQDAPPHIIKGVLGKRLGISRNSLVVIYSDGADSLDTRFWWTLEHLGHRNMCILSGGFDKWQEDSYKAVKKPTRAQPVEYDGGELDQGCQVDTNWVLEHLADPELKLVFIARYSFHYGQKAMCPREGHIPGAVCVPLASHFNKDSTWKSPAELRRMYHSLGVTEDKMVITQCFHGVNATAGYFALRYILGYPRVSLYSASMAGWCHDPRNLPLDTYGNPQLLKDTNWVSYWSEQAHARMNDTRVRIVDVRPAADYEQGHIPYALSFPVQRALDLSAPRKLRAMLGKIGIAADTKVLLYDQGDALQAAWLFWVLEYLGHNDVSILNGGFARWQAEKRKVAKEATTIRKSKPQDRFDVCIRPASFAATVQSSKIATPDWMARSSKNANRAFVNSDAAPDKVATEVPEAKHVPWSSNLTEEGVFKTAAELAKVYLDKSGLDPTKEVVCCAEEPMPAAHTYFSLRLLGFPRVRLCSRR